MRIIVIGGSGHVGSYLIPLLVERGHQVVNVSRGNAQPYRPHSAWKRVEQVVADRSALEADGSFGEKIAALHPDIVIDMIAFELDSVKHIHQALKGKIDHYIFCSTVWVYGHSVTIPTTEAEPCVPIDDYGKKKLAIEQYLMGTARREGFPATSFRPGHIVGEGWIPINPQGNLDPQIYTDIAAGRSITLPDLGLGQLHHVHADDLARWVLAAIDNRTATIGECFNTVSSQAITLRGYAEAMYAYFGQTPDIKLLPLEHWKQSVDAKHVDATISHISHSPCSSIEKSRVRLGWTPRYTSLEAVQESVRALIKEGKVSQ